MSIIDHDSTNVFTRKREKSGVARALEHLDILRKNEKQQDRLLRSLGTGM